MSTEKITLNINSIDLANIDLLVENGFAANRSELMKTAIKNYLLKLDEETKELLQAKKHEAGIEKAAWFFGFNKIDMDYIKAQIKANMTVKVLAYGTITIDKKIPIELLKQYITDIKVYGVFKAQKEVKDYYKNK